MADFGDWLQRPLAVIDKIFEHNGSDSDWQQSAIQFFEDKLQEDDSMMQVPSLNDVPLHLLQPNCLVRFRCMVQDMFDPEFYAGVYEVLDPNTQEKVLKSGKYRDVVDCAQANLQFERNFTADRQTLYCIPIPGEAAWVKEKFYQLEQGRTSPSTLHCEARNKRSLDEDGSTQAAVDGRLGRNVKRHEQPRPAGIDAGSTARLPLDLNFPLPEEKGPACLVKVYDNWDTFKVNDVVEVFGILSMDPAMSLLEDNSDETEARAALQVSEEDRCHHPPASLVPRLHLLFTQKLRHINPLLPRNPHEDTMEDLRAARAELLGFLTHATLGDELAAEYLLFHLLSSVYARRDVMPMGKFTLNLSGCANSNYSQELYAILRQLVPTSFRLPMTLEVMNGQRFCPRKDYSANRLLAGILQLSSGSLLMIDETELQTGQLDVTGVQNITALGNAITWQKVDYDFDFHQMEFPCNLNIVVTSEGKSLLPSDCQVRLKPQVVLANFNEYFGALRNSLSPALLDKFRVYLTLTRMMEYNIDDVISKAVEEDFVEMRRLEPDSITAENLHMLLTVARLLSLSVGQSSLTMLRWQRTKELEFSRRARPCEDRATGAREL
uniref:Mini-chromosome maintenance complex-binding protein n=1 Tax=Eptatretus burgeri TaxID=7764 RepID=A0A8C4Q7A1_EPTBU